MLHALIRSLRRSTRPADQAQLALEFDAAAPRDATELLARLRALGLRGVQHLVLTRNHRTMVSVAGHTLRVQRGYLAAPGAVHQAIVDFVMTPRRDHAVRHDSRRSIVAFASALPKEEGPVRVERTHPDDAALAATLATHHARLNAERFGGALAAIPIRVSRRMRSRLGHYTPRRGGVAPEIAISRRHARRHGLESVLQTLLHEMVHQWQDEQGMAVDHGAAFKRRAREVGIPPRATRAVD